jgi:short-subunit dehydrogenase
MKLDGCMALITGASAGLGREFARQLAKRARGLVLVARRGDRLNELRTEVLACDPNLIVHVRIVDLCEQSQINDLTKWVEEEKIDIDLLINNAGLGDVGPFATSDPLRNHEILQVNVVALTALTRALLPQMLSRKRGAILNVSSSAGFLPIPEFNVYAATKAYVNSFSESLRPELRRSGISVTTLCPGPVRTEFQSIAQRPGGQPEYGPDFIHVSPEQVIRDALAAIEADRPLVIPGAMMKLGMFLVRLTPMSILRLAWRLSPRR